MPWPPSRTHLAGHPAGLETYTTGDGPILAAYNTETQQSVDSTTWITIVLVIVILLLIYRSPVSPLIPLITIALAYLISRGVVAFLGAHVMTISAYTNIFIIVVLFGAGTDYCLFLISRFREEMTGAESPGSGRQDHGAGGRRDHRLERRHGHRRRGHDGDRRARPLQHQRPQPGHRRGHRPAGGPHAHPRHAAGARSPCLLAAQGPPHEGGRHLERLGGQGGQAPAGRVPHPGDRLGAPRRSTAAGSAATSTCWPTCPRTTSSGWASTCWPSTSAPGRCSPSTSWWSTPTVPTRRPV